MGRLLGIWLSDKVFQVKESTISYIFFAIKSKVGGGGNNDSFFSSSSWFVGCKTIEKQVGHKGSTKNRKPDALRIIPANPVWQPFLQFSLALLTLWKDSPVSPPLLSSILLIHSPCTSASRPLPERGAWVDPADANRELTPIWYRK